MRCFCLSFSIAHAIVHVRVAMVYGNRGHIMKAGIAHGHLNHLCLPWLKPCLVIFTISINQSITYLLYVAWIERYKFIIKWFEKGFICCLFDIYLLVSGLSLILCIKVFLICFFKDKRRNMYGLCTRPVVLNEGLTSCLE